jgi:hypothetical protein
MNMVMNVKCDLLKDAAFFMVMNLCVPQQEKNFLTSSGSINKQFENFYAISQSLK